MAMKIISTAFEPNEGIPRKYTCDGQNVNPPLRISGVPGKARSLALIMEDPDVPVQVRMDGTWDHWVVYNIPPHIDTVEENSEPSGTPGKGTNGRTGYMGPCPPDRKHRYFFKLFALDVDLDIPPAANKKQVEAAMQGHIIEKAELVGTYARS
jgi:Raf kinase inhibitor-like YbhB/YbcL family protein